MNLATVRALQEDVRRAYDNLNDGEWSYGQFAMELDNITEVYDDLCSDLIEPLIRARNACDTAPTDEIGVTSYIQTALIRMDAVWEAVPDPVEHCKSCGYPTCKCDRPSYSMSINAFGEDIRPKGETYRTYKADGTIVDKPVLQVESWPELQPETDGPHMPRMGLRSCQ